MRMIHVSYGMIVLFLKLMGLMYNRIDKYVSNINKHAHTLVETIVRNIIVMM